MIKNWMTVLTCLIAVLLITTACSSNSNSEASKENDNSGSNDDVVTMAIISTWDTLNVYNTSGNYGNAVADQLFERLVYRTHDGKIKPRLAQSWEMATDSKSMTFELADNAIWHDGEKLTANDIVFTVKAMTDESVDNYYRSEFAVLAGTDENGVAEKSDNVGVEAVDEHTVKFEFKEAVNEDRILNAFLSFLYILPEHKLGEGDYASINDSEFWNAPIGAGPFKYVKDESGTSLELEAFEDYYQGSPDFKTLVIRVVSAENLTPGLIKGDIDVVAMGSIPLSDWDSVKNAEDIVAAPVEDYTYQYMLFNLSESNDAFHDSRVRSAFDMAINKQQIVDKLMLGEGKVAVGPMPEYHPYFNEKLSGNSYNSEEAKKLLEESGFDFNREYRMLVPQGNQVREQSALLIQQDLAAIGVKISIETYDFATLLSMLSEGEADLGLLGGGSNIDPGESSVILKPGDSRNYSLLTDSKWYDIAEKGAKLTDFNERKEVYDDYQIALAEDQPYIWLYHQNNLWAYNKRLSNVPIDDFVWMNFGTWNWKLSN
ncbi:peptide ABC transporter substrate-binding protein [Virgibacillus dakarensis]|uniref:Peptide ABC transporter substrate-binding protein n=1 Tax=Lentibacillus populi TaxID=1827502 RepID=A0A9W5TX76_9BACI|nr:peptide ABC transporter substrate-binding protein [Lentibacillus populi]MTW85814.1 peptide ABC transporter substrate-binding protein [Virgibacillus dakarensis]GGB39183.1 peptide ABC transporter substrate-binding protein [Lentibacillus populi]